MKALSTSSQINQVLNQFWQLLTQTKDEGADFDGKSRALYVTYFAYVKRLAQNESIDVSLRAKAQYMLAMAFTPQSDSQLEWLAKAAQSGYVDAHYQLGKMCLAQKDYAKAAQYFSTVMHSDDSFLKAEVQSLVDAHLALAYRLNQSQTTASSVSSAFFHHSKTPEETNDMPSQGLVY